MPNPPTVEISLAETVEIFLAAIAGLRKHEHGKGLPRFRAPKVQTPGQARRVERARYARLEDGFRVWVQRHYKRFTDGDIGVAEFYTGMKNELYQFHLRMYVLGRRAVGRTDHKLDESELKMLHGVHSSEMRYFNGFLRDYLTGGGKMPFHHRLDLYALGGYSTYLRGAIMALPGAYLTKWKWIVNHEAEHCPTCIKNEEESNEQGGFTLKEIIEERGFPGEKTICMNRCRCHLEPEDASVLLPRTRPVSYRHVEKKLNEQLRKVSRKNRNPGFTEEATGTKAGTKPAGKRAGSKRSAS